ncbi:MAG: winged helix-turn-helix domain-containing protein [Ilumatobacteraceae bacterium]
MSDVRKKRDVRKVDDRPRVPDYDLAETVPANTPAQLKALADPIRGSILHLLAERAATTTELAEALDRPKGTVDHHLKVLQRAGFVKVVRSRKVRALTERFWGRTARTIMIERTDIGAQRDDHGFLAEAMSTFRIGDPSLTTLRYARIPEDRVAEYAARLDALAMEFIDERRGGDTVYGLLLALAPTDQPALRDHDDG